MKPTKRLLAAIFALGTLAILSFTTSVNKPIHRSAEPTVAPKIQAAILLDVSNSMDGLIEQAKAQLWNMVSVMGKAKCSNDVNPQIEIALYEYGRSSNAVADGYVKQISPFTTDLDKLSKELFGLTTNGGDEYCGQVIFTSLNQLNWDAGSNNYKVIFIAGNEDFLQGSLRYTQACAEATKKGVVVNTIYCGSKADGIREHWNLGAECGTGSFTNINSDVKIEEIPTPYDSVIFALNSQLNNTYIAYGYAGAGKKQMQTEVDQLNYSTNKSAAVKRVAVKSQGNLYKNDSWDLVDRGLMGDSKEFLAKLDKKTLPDSLQKKTTEELKQIIDAKNQQRGQIQKQIETVNAQRDAYIAEERKKNAAQNKEATLETEVEKIIKVQAKRYNMLIQ